MAHDERLCKERDRQLTAAIAALERLHTSQRVDDRSTLQLLCEDLERRIAAADELCNERINQVSHELHAALETNEQAIAKADAATELRFHNVNEFRAVLAHQQTAFVTQETYTSAHQGLIDKIEAIDRAAAVTHRSLDDKINANSSSIIEIRTAATTTSSNRSLLISIIGLLLVVASAAFALYGVTKS